MKNPASKFDTTEARKTQLMLAGKVVKEDSFPTPIKLVGGLDLAYKEEEASVAYVVFGYQSLKLLHSEAKRVAVKVPYLPTFLSFREGPPIIDAIKNTKVKADICMINGQGIAHPYRIGLASHVGVLADVPTIGVAKNLLCGAIQERDAAKSPIIDSGEVIGMALRMKPHSSRLYVSIGHKISLESSIEIVSSFMINHSLPEPLWMAHTIAKETLFKTPSRT